ncbi:MAG TPA: FAD-binding oxidoreductase [Solirubrobacterales bacterium]|nr:FAD-binding oxidoreductase [Solirubrobacterales bacterium]
MLAPPDPEKLAALRATLGGSVLADGEPGYEDARAVFNAMIEKRPAAIAQCESADDVRAALAFARESGLEVAVRGGGHSVAGAALSEGGLTIDLRRMNAARVDPGARTITVQGGATWADFDSACQPHGLAGTGGRVSTTGVAGLALGGGSGWLERKFGLACDSLVAAELITADGRSVHASESENPELFWALHGGGGNFGIATALTFRLHELPEFTAALLVWPAADGAGLVRAYRELLERAPDEVGGFLAYITGPEEDFVPATLHGELVCAVLVTYAGPEGKARDAFAPLAALEPAGELVAEMPYAELQSMLDDPPGYRNYWSAEYLAELPDAAVDVFTIAARGIIVPSPTQHILFPWGGAVTSQSAGSPLATRDAPWVVHPLTMWEDPADDERAIAWTRELCAAIAPWSTGATYLNFVGDEGEERILSGYGAANYTRLAAVKAEYDPDNVFHLHHPVRPLTA